MLISFFEEFPNPKNLRKLKLVTWPTKLYLAAKSLAEFNRIKLQIKQKKVIECIYWPILKKKAGYWISPFTDRKALLKIMEELNNQNVSIVLDLELPTTKNPWLYFTQLLNFNRNKKLITNFINKYKGKIYLAEYYPEGRKKERILKALGLHYPNKKVKVIKMLYSSLHHFNKNFFQEELKQGKKEYKSNYLVALGTIAQGINKNEPKLSKEQLRQDLLLAKKYQVKEAVIYRLGGLDEEYVKMIKPLSK